MWKKNCPRRCAMFWNRFCTYFDNFPIFVKNFIQFSHIYKFIEPFLKKLSIAKFGKLTFHSSQNIAQHFGPNTQIGHFWVSLIFFSYAFQNRYKNIRAGPHNKLSSAQKWNINSKQNPWHDQTSFTYGTLTLHQSSL